MPRKNHIWTIKDLEYLRVMYVVLTRKELAQKLGVTQSKVRDALKRYGLSKPWRKKHKRWTEADLEVIRAKYPTMKAPELAAELGVSKTTLFGVLHRYGLSKRYRRRKDEIIKQAA